MGLCGGEAKKKKALKTIIIPKGVINPNENNIIEIPLHLDANSNLIVKAPTDSKACLSVEPYYSGPINSFNNNNDNQIHFAPRSATIPAQVPENINPAVEENPVFSMPLPDPLPTYLSTPPAQPVPSTVGKKDFSCQAQTPQPVPVQYQPQTSLQTETVHSPLCPICARASSRYISPYSNLYSYLTPKYSQYPCNYSSAKAIDNHLPCRSPAMSNYNPPTYSCFEPSLFSPPMKYAKSEVIVRPEKSTKPAIDENALLNKLLDDKIEKILKPILMSLAKSIPDKEEVMSKCSYSTIGSKYSRGVCSPQHRSFQESSRRSPPELDYSYSKYDRGRSKLSNDSYDNFRRDVSLRDTERYSEPDKWQRGYLDPITITGGNLMNMRDRSSEEDMISRRRRPRSPGREFNLDCNLDLKSRNGQKICPTTTGCEKRSNVFFDPWQNNDLTSQNSADSSELRRTDHDKSHNGDLNKSIYFK